MVVRVIEAKEDKILQALETGADYAFNSAVSNIHEELFKIFPNGVDILLDAAGVPELINTNLKLVKDYGDVCVYGVTPKNELLMSWQEAPYSFNLRFAQWPSKKEEAAVHEEVIHLMRQGVLKGEDYISDIFDFDDAVEAIEFFKTHKNKKKVVIRM